MGAELGEADVLQVHDVYYPLHQLDVRLFSALLQYHIVDAEWSVIDCELLFFRCRSLRHSPTSVCVVYFGWCCFALCLSFGNDIHHRIQPLHVVIPGGYFQLHLPVPGALSFWSQVWDTLIWLFSFIHDQFGCGTRLRRSIYVFAHILVELAWFNPLELFDWRLLACVCRLAACWVWCQFILHLAGNILLDLCRGPIRTYLWATSLLVARGQVISWSMRLYCLTCGWPCWWQELVLVCIGMRIVQAWDRRLLDGGSRSWKSWQLELGHGHWARRKFPRRERRRTRLPLLREIWLYGWWLLKAILGLLWKYLVDSCISALRLSSDVLFLRLRWFLALIAFIQLNIDCLQKPVISGLRTWALLLYHWSNICLLGRVIDVLPDWQRFARIRCSMRVGLIHGRRRLLWSEIGR